MIFWILFILVIIIIYKNYHPFIDIFDDYRGEHHIILWYDDNKKERKYINILGSQ